VVGAVRVRAPRERIVARYRDVSNLARSQMVLQLGTFSSPAVADDLRTLSFEEYDLASVRECAPGDCPVRLPASSLSRFQQGVNWQAADWREQTSNVWRQVLVDYVTAYRATGDRALAEYHNKEDPLRMRDEFTILFRESEMVELFAPQFTRYLQQYPRVTLKGTEDVVYWSKENFGIRPVLSVSHLTTYLPPGSRQAFVATKQIYATHYFDAGLAVTLVLDDGNGGYYLVSMSRIRTRSLTSFFRGFVRSTVQNRSRDGVEKMLRSTKAAVER
jgi:hypothetical protein